MTSRKSRKYAAAGMLCCHTLWLSSIFTRALSCRAPSYTLELWYTATQTSFHIGLGLSQLGRMGSTIKNSLLQMTRPCPGNHMGMCTILLLATVV